MHYAATRHFGTRPFVSWQVPRTTNHSARACHCQTTVCLAVRLSPPLHPILTSTTTAQVSGPEQSRPVLPRHATRSARTHAHIFVRPLSVVPHGDHLQGFGPGVCALVSSNFSFQALGWAVQVAVAHAPLSGQRYICAQHCTATTLVDALTYFVLLGFLLALLISYSYTLIRTRTTLFLDQRSDRPVPLRRLCWLCCAVLVYCTVCCTGPSRLNSSAVSPRRVLVTGPSICDVIAVTSVWPSTHWKLLPTCT